MTTLSSALEEEEPVGGLEVSSVENPFTDFRPDDELFPETTTVTESPIFTTEFLPVFTTASQPIFTTEFLPIFTTKTDEDDPKSITTTAQEPML
jgi:hypothetical protein